MFKRFAIVVLALVACAAPALALAMKASMSAGNTGTSRLRMRDIRPLRGAVSRPDVSRRRPSRVLETEEAVD